MNVFALRPTRQKPCTKTALTLSFVQGFSLITKSPFGAPESQRDGSGTRMGADTGSDIGNQNLFGMNPFPHQRGHKLSVLRRIPVADKDGIVFWGFQP